MADFTPNYNLKKPLRTEYYNVADANGNSDIVDTQLKAVNDRVDLIESDVDAIELGKADKTYVDAQLADIASGTGLLNNAVTPEKTSFMSLGKNLINPDEFIDGAYVNQLTGAIAYYAGLFCSGLIEIVPGGTYYYQNSLNGASDFRSAWYDANGVFISGAQGAFSLLVAPANAKYFRFSTKSEYINAIHQLVLGDAPSSIEEYGYTIEDVYISSKFVVDDNDILINLPATIPAIVGQQIDIYFANITNVNLKDYDIDVICATGKHMDDGFHIAIWSAGTYPITINIYRKGKLKASASSNIVVKAATIGNGVTKKVLYIGDSTIAQNTLTQGLLDKFAPDVMKVSLLGTKGTAPNKHEGVSGWTLGNFRLSGSAFFNGTDFNLGYYLTQNALANPDYIILQLGINDVFSMTDDIALETTLGFVLAHYNFVINNIKAHSSAIKIGVCLTIPPNASQDAFGNAYNCGQTRWRYLKNNKILVDRLMKAFKGREAENIYLIPNNAFINTVTNITDAVHPTTAGYGQLSNLHYAWLKSFEV